MWLISAILFFFLESFWLARIHLHVYTMDAHAFNAPASRRIIGYQCKNPRCGKFFCKCLSSRTSSTATILPGRELFARVSQCAKNSPEYAVRTVPFLFSALVHTKVWMDHAAHRAMCMLRSPREMLCFRAGTLDSFRTCSRTCSKSVKILLKNANFWTVLVPYLRSKACSKDLEGFKQF